MIEFIKSPSNVWRKFPQSKPKNNDFYLLELSPDFRDHPTYLVAKFDKGKWLHSDGFDVYIPQVCSIRYRPIEGRVALSIGEACDLADAIGELWRNRRQDIPKNDQDCIERFSNFLCEHKIVQCYAYAHDEDRIIK